MKEIDPEVPSDVKNWLKTRDDEHDGICCSFGSRNHEHGSHDIHKLHGHDNCHNSNNKKKTNYKNEAHVIQNYTASEMNIISKIIKEETSEFTEEENKQIDNSCVYDCKFKNSSPTKILNNNRIEREEINDINSDDNKISVSKKDSSPVGVPTKGKSSNTKDIINTKFNQAVKIKNKSTNVINNFRDDIQNDFAITRTKVNRKSETHIRSAGISEICK